jgi:hypothetical protein
MSVPSQAPSLLLLLLHLLLLHLLLLLLLLLLLQVLVLDVGSLHPPETAAPNTEAAAAAAANPEASAPASLHIKSVQECSLHCALIPGCNDFSYCSTTTGCGTGCAEWAAQHSPGEPCAQPLWHTVHSAQGSRPWGNLVHQYSCSS